MTANGLLACGVRGKCDRCKQPSTDLRARKGKVLCPGCDPKEDAPRQTVGWMKLLGYLRELRRVPSVKELVKVFPMAPQSMYTHLDRLALKGHLVRRDDWWALAS